MATASAKAHRRSRLHEEEEEHVNHERWLITYADMITLLMVLFIVLYSISQVDLAKFRRLKEGVAGGFGGPAAAGALSGGAGPLEGGGGVFDAGLHGTEAVTSAQAAQAALADAQAKAAGARQQRSVLQGAQQEIQRSLDKEGLSDTVKFRLEARGLVVTIVSDKVLFDPGQADLRPEGRDIVDKLAAAIGRLPNKLSVEGHTDNTPISGRYPSNWELSTARATTVLRELIEGHGISPARLQAAGYADERPVAGNATPEGRSANRRVELVVLADVSAALNDIASGNDPPVGEVNPNPTEGK
ncbi:MAG TPA: flagellar motor protein MotB [Acidimicrobiia bacterium]|nr:flagellar motor protein MotB [Acidimicrobiia bacterium]